MMMLTIVSMIALTTAKIWNNRGKQQVSEQIKQFVCGQHHSLTIIRCTNKRKQSSTLRPSRTVGSTLCTGRYSSSLSYKPQYA